MGVIKFFHQLFRPNCSCNICSAPKCESCETLRMQLSLERQSNQQLIQCMIAQVTPQTELIKQEVKEFKPIGNQALPWRVQQQMLEKEDKQAAKLLRQKAAESEARSMSTADLEKELGIPDNEEGA